jgi:ATP phosphoribosyltransferase
MSKAPLKVAVPNKGSLSESSTALLKAAGYKTRTDAKQLILEDAQNDVQFFYLRPRDIATYVGSGILDAGITGQDLLLDASSSAVEIQALGFARSTFRFACPSSKTYKGVQSLRGKRIATAYPTLLGDYLQGQNVEASVVKLDGAVESAIELGVADIIADVVSTGTTLKQAGLKVFGDPIVDSQAILIKSPKVDELDAGLMRLIKRFEGVLTARKYVLLDYDVPESALAAAVKITPGFEGPTVTNLPHKNGGVAWSAVRVMIPERDVNQIMDDLHDVGARAILVTQILASRL